MAEKKNPLAAAAGTTGGKYRGMTGAMPRRRKATQLLLLAINIYIAITFWYWVRYYETAVVRHLSPDREVSKAGYRLPV